MNYNFDRYNSAGTRGEKIEIDTDIFADWIMDYYAHKNAAFFITKKNDFIIFPTERLKHYLKISAKFRIKKSGSNEPSRKYTDAVKNIISAEYPSTQFFNNGKKLFADIPETVSDVRFSLQKYDYILSAVNNDFYEVRQLSNTYNMNVIFSIKAKREQLTEDFYSFVRALNLS